MVAAGAKPCTPMQLGLPFASCPGWETLKAAAVLDLGNFGPETAKTGPEFRKIQRTGVTWVSFRSSYVVVTVHRVKTYCIGLVTDNDLPLTLHNARLLGCAVPRYTVQHVPGVKVICRNVGLLVRMSLTSSAKAFCVSAPSVRNSLSYSNCRSAELLSTFKRLLKTELFDIAYSEREHSA